MLSALFQIRRTAQKIISSASVNGGKDMTVQNNISWSTLSAVGHASALTVTVPPRGFLVFEVCTHDGDVTPKVNAVPLHNHVLTRGT